jgi:hypothetical protein
LESNIWIPGTVTPNHIGIPTKPSCLPKVKKLGYFVVHVYNSNYSGGIDQEDYSFMLAKAQFQQVNWA